MGVLGVDEVRLEVLELRQAAEIGERGGVIEQMLVRQDVGGSLLGCREVDVGLEIAADECPFQFDAFIIALRVTEGAQDQRLTSDATPFNSMSPTISGVSCELL